MIISALSYVTAPQTHLLAVDGSVFAGRPRSAQDALGPYNAPPLAVQFVFPGNILLGSEPVWRFFFAQDVNYLDERVLGT